MNNYFSTNLKYIRETKHISQNSLSKLTNVSQATINRWESGENIPSIDNAIDIANVLNISIEDLIVKDMRNNISTNLNKDNLIKILKDKGLLNSDGNLDIDKVDKIIKICDLLDSIEKD